MKKEFLIALIIISVLSIFLILIPKKTTKDEPINTNLPQNQTPGPSNPPSTPSINYYYPITNYDDRIKVKAFGQYFAVGSFPPICGKAFVGYHNGDDLEATSAESESNLPVYAINDGIIRQISSVSGYGGLLIMETNINGQILTVNYGHISLGTTKVKVGDNIKAGDELGFLGRGCSSETDGERKHLHFSIHKGSAIDVRGYVQSTSQLSEWVNPKEFLRNIGAKEVNS